MPTTFALRLKEALALRGIRAAKLAEMTGLSRPRISQYTNGVYTPGGEALCRMATALSVNEAWLMGEDVPMETIHGTVPEAEIIPLPDNMAPLHLRAYPVLGRIACGEPILAVEEADEVAISDVNGADFCLTAKGDSMIGARIFDGDEVFIRSTDMVNNGDIAAVVVDDEATLKRVYYYPEEQRIVLAPENPNYQPMEFKGHALNHIRILGKAVAVQTKL